MFRSAGAEDAIKTAASVSLDAIIVHRAHEGEPVTLVKEIRAVSPTVLIIVLSTVDRSEPVLAAGADGFLSTDQWLMLGTAVANALAARNSG